MFDSGKNNKQHNHHLVTLGAVLPSPRPPRKGEDDEEGKAQLVELPAGLRALAGKLRELTLKSDRLAEVPVGG